MVLDSVYFSSNKILDVYQPRVNKEDIVWITRDSWNFFLVFITYFFNFIKFAIQLPSSSYDVNIIMHKWETI